MDLHSLEPLDLEAWASLVNGPGRGLEDPATTSSVELVSPTHPGPPWHEPSAYSQDEWLSIGSGPSLEHSLSAIFPEKVVSLATAAGVLSAVPITGVEYQRKTPSLQPSLQATGTCSCLRNFLSISEHLDQHPATSLSFASTLALFQKAIRVCERYMQCKVCDESLPEILCVSALRRASVSYRQIAVAAQSSAFDAVGERKFRCKVGQFETDVILDLDTLKAVLCSELERASTIVVEIEKLLGPGTETRRPVDPVTRRYHQDLMKKAHNDIQTSLNSLRQA